MLPSTKEIKDNSRALRKLINKWRASRETRPKADLLLTKNPKLKPTPNGPSKKA